MRAVPKNEMNHKERELRRKQRGKILLLCTGVLMLFSFLPVGQSLWRQVQLATGLGSLGDYAPQAPLRIHFIDVGKADAIFLECEGETALLDAGTFEDGEGVSAYLLQSGIRQLDYLIASHPDADHIGGMPVVLENISVSTYLSYGGPGPKSDTPEDARLRRGLAENKVVSRSLSFGDTFSLGGAVFRVLSPTKEYRESNNASLGLELTYQHFSALFCGDMEEEAELFLVKSGEVKPCDLLKVAHHGSNSSSTRRFLQAVRPRFGVISSGYDRNNLPREEVLERLKEQNTQIYRTDWDGDILFSVDGTPDGITVTCEKRKDMIP